MNPQPAESLQPILEHQVLAEVEGVSVMIETEFEVKTETAPELTEDTIETSELTPEYIAEAIDFFEEQFNEPAALPISRIPHQVQKSDELPVIATPENAAGMVEWELAG